MNWDLDVNTLIQIFTIASIAGMGWQKISTLEASVARLELEVIDHRDLKSDLAVVQSQLVQIRNTLDSLYAEKSNALHALELVLSKIAPGVLKEKE